MRASLQSHARRFLLRTSLSVCVSSPLPTHPRTNAHHRYTSSIPRSMQHHRLIQPRSPEPEPGGRQEPPCDAQRDRRRRLRRRRRPRRPPHPRSRRRAQASRLRRRPELQLQGAPLRLSPSPQFLSPASPPSHSVASPSLCMSRPNFPILLLPPPSLPHPRLSVSFPPPPSLILIFSAVIQSLPISLPPSSLISPNRL
jgi:hypothetical protein